MAKKGHPRITGVCLGFDTSWFSKTMKSNRYMKSTTCIRTSVIFLWESWLNGQLAGLWLGSGSAHPTQVVDILSMGAGWCWLPNPEVPYWSVYPIVQAMVGQPGSLYLTRIWPDMNSLMFVMRKTYLGTLVFLFWCMSLRNFACEGTCWMASRRDTLIFTYLKSSSVFCICAMVMLFLSLVG